MRVEDFGTVEGESTGTSVEEDGRLTDFDVDVSNVVLFEESFAAEGDRKTVFTGERCGRDANPENDGVYVGRDAVVVAVVAPGGVVDGDDVCGGPEDVEGVEEGVEAGCETGLPDACEGMVSGGGGELLAAGGAPL